MDHDPRTAELSKHVREQFRRPQRLVRRPPRDPVARAPVDQATAVAIDRREVDDRDRFPLSDPLSDRRNCSELHRAPASSEVPRGNRRWQCRRRGGPDAASHLNRQSRRRRAFERSSPSETTLATRPTAAVIQHSEQVWSERRAPASGRFPHGPPAKLPVRPFPTALSRSLLRVGRGHRRTRRSAMGRACSRRAGSAVGGAGA